MNRYFMYIQVKARVHAKHRTLIIRPLLLLAPRSLPQRARARPTRAVMMPAGGKKRTKKAPKAAKIRPMTPNPSLAWAYTLKERPCRGFPPPPAGPGGE